MELVANGVSDDCVIIAQQKLALVHRPQFDAFDLNLIGPDFNGYIAVRVALGGHSNRLRQDYRRLIAGLPLWVVSGLRVAKLNLPVERGHVDALQQTHSPPGYLITTRNG